MSSSSSRTSSSYDRVGFQSSTSAPLTGYHLPIARKIRTSATIPAAAIRAKSIAGSLRRYPPPPPTFQEEDQLDRLRAHRRAAPHPRDRSRLHRQRDRARSARQRP